MSHLRLPLTIILVATLGVPILCPAADLFSSQQQKEGFLKALRDKDAQYDPAEKMIRRPFSSPGYHTTLKGGYVHPTRDSLQYAVALLDSGQPDRLTAHWRRPGKFDMSLTLPKKPLRSSAQQTTASATKNGKDPWKSTGHLLKK